MNDDFVAICQGSVDALLSATRTTGKMQITPRATAVDSQGGVHEEERVQT
jgi:hypothetical protein